MFRRERTSCEHEMLEPNPEKRSPLLLARVSQPQLHDAAPGMHYQELLGEIAERSEQARQNSDVNGLLQALISEIVVWTRELKQETLELFSDSERGAYGRQLLKPSHPRIQLLPGYIMHEFAVVGDALDLVELAIGRSQSESLSVRLGQFDDRRRLFAIAVAELAATWDGRNGTKLDQFVELDRKRSDLKHYAVGLCRYIDTLRHFAAGRDAGRQEGASSGIGVTDAAPFRGATALMKRPIDSSAGWTQADHPPATTQVSPPVRADGAYAPSKVVFLGREHECELSKREMTFINVALKDKDVDIHTLMHPKNGILWKQRYVAKKHNRDIISKFLSRLNKKLLFARPQLGFTFTLLRNQAYIHREDLPQSGR